VAVLGPNIILEADLQIKVCKEVTVFKTVKFQLPRWIEPLLRGDFNEGVDMMRDDRFMPDITTAERACIAQAFIDQGEEY